MNDIANAEIRVTIKEAACTLVGTIILLGGVLWAVLSFTLDGLKTDVSFIRTSIADLQNSDKASISRDASLDKDLRTQINDIHRTVIGQQRDLDHLTSAVDELTRRVNVVAPANLQYGGKSLELAFEKAGIKTDQIEGVFFAPVSKSGTEIQKLPFLPQKAR